MALTRTECPECGAGLKLPVGFQPGRTVCCSKCETYFVVEDKGGAEPPPAKKPRPAAAPAGKRPVRAAADDEEADDEPRPRKKKRGAAADDEEWSYSNSWIRYAVLAVLLAVLGVLGYMLYEKRQKEKDGARNDPPDPGAGAAEPAPVVPVAKGGKLDAKIGPAPLPDLGKKQTPIAIAPPVEEVRKRLVGRWEYREEGEVYTVEYRADGSFSYTTDRDGKAEKFAGRWTPGTAGLFRAAGAPPDQLSVGFDVEWTVGAGPGKKGSASLEPDGSLHQNLLGRLLYDTPGPSVGKFVRK